MTSLTSWGIGVCLGIGSSIISNIGVNIQKLVHSRRACNRSIMNSTTHINMSRMTSETLADSSFVISPAIHTRDLTSFPLITTPAASYHSLVVVAKQRPYIMDAWWICGLILQIMGAFMDFLALGFAPASVVAPLGSITLVTNVALAPIMHHESPSRKVLCATALIIFGTITTVIFSPRVTGVNTTEQLFGVFASTAFVWYAIPCSVILSVSFGIKTYMNYLKRTIQNRYGTLHYKLHRFSIATLSGTMGAQNIFFAKCVSTLMVFTIEGNGKTMFVYWQTYVVAISMFTTIYLQLKWLNDGLIEFSALYIVPIFQSFWITVSVIGGLTVYEEFDKMKVYDKLVFPIGVIVTITGVAFLTSQRKPTSIKTRGSKKIITTNF